MKSLYDLIIIGGGINGTGIARDAAGRGLRVLLCEQDDLASHTSSASTKLIHGGLRYLEHYEFGLVRKALQERHVLLHMAPHIIHPMRFIMPDIPDGRPAWLIRLGLFLYDHLAARSALLPGSKRIDLQGGPLKSSFKKGFVYSDAQVDDARLVVLNARDAADRGAEIRTRTRFVSAKRLKNKWKCQLENGEVEGRILLNAAGPWVDRVIQSSSAHRIRLVKGSHIVTKRLFDHNDAYIFQNTDKRVIFAIPYESDFTLIGTTDLDYQGDPAAVAISESEIIYLCDAVNRYFKKAVQPEQVIWSYSGVRPLLEEEMDNPSAVTRDYRLDWNKEKSLLSVFGGKITTYRRLAEEAMELLGYSNHWTAHAPLPGGDIPDADFPRFLADVKQRYSWLPARLIERYARAYGTQIDILLASKDLGILFGNDLYEVEVRYLIEREWAMTAEDILWRRSKLGLYVDKETIERLNQWL